MDFDQLAEQVDRLTDELLGLEDAAARALGIQLKEAVEAIHREALVRIVRRLKQEESTLAALRELAQDPAVRAILMLHEILRPPPGARVQMALDEVRPYIHSHGGEVELVELQGGTVRLRLAGACQGCPGSQATLRNGVEQALRRHLPELERIELVEDAPASGALISPATIGVAGSPPPPYDPADGWRLALPLAQLAPGVLRRVVVEGGDLILAMVDGRPVCYHNTCAHMAMPLHDGDLSGGVLTCPWHGFAYLIASGECLTAPEVQLEPCPVRVRAGQIEVRV
ncbi:MAG: Rieske 2Fe-2S domain-containing protein [Chloroflexales bacterium]|nr:Rieske 2Fe-2S domain-containing protein [Chloroflexales bacterium]